MKKVLLILLGLTMAISLVAFSACKDGGKKTSTPSVTESVTGSEEQTEVSDTATSSEEQSEASVSDEQSATETSQESADSASDSTVEEPLEELYFVTVGGVLYSFEEVIPEVENTREFTAYVYADAGYQIKVNKNDDDITSQIDFSELTMFVFEQEGAYYCTGKGEVIVTFVISEQGEYSLNIAFASAFEVTFALQEHVTSIIVYPAQDYETENVVTLENGGKAYSRDSEFGHMTTTDGQVNFKVVLEEGYMVDAISVVEGTFSNVKTVNAADSIYRVTKIKADTTVTISAKEIPQEEITEYVVNFVYDSALATVNVYYTQNYATPSAEGVTSVEARNSETGEITLTDGQINFAVVLLDTENQYNVTVTGAPTNNYNKMKTLALATDGIDGYRFTKITGNFTVTITIELVTE